MQEGTLDNTEKTLIISPEPKEASERIRAELNIEKWPAIWKPAFSKSPPAVRVLERETALADGGSVKARVEIGLTHLGELTTEDQKTYYALVKQWEVSGRPDAQTFFSVRGVARFLQKRWGTNVIDSITQSLRRLRATPFTWENAYRDGQSKDVIEEIDMFNILSELKIVRKKTDGHVTHEAGYFRFNDFTLRNLEANHTKPVLLDTILNFHSEVAQLLYTHVDLILATKPRYERRSKDLLAEVGIKNKEYSRVYERRRLLERALRELQGVELSTGVLKTASLVPTRDHKDYKVVFEKVAKSSVRRQQDKEGTDAGANTITAVTERNGIAVAAANLVKLFHNRFYGIDRVYPQSKEVEQATCLIARHGIEQARFIVEFSLHAAEKTGYMPQTFGGILQYTSRALHAYDAAHRGNTPAASFPGAKRHDPAEDARTKYTKTEAQLKKLPAEKYAALRDRAKTEVVTRLPWLAKYEGKPAFEAILRGQIAMEFAREQAPSTEISDRIHES